MRHRTQVSFFPLALTLTQVKQLTKGHRNANPHCNGGQHISWPMHADDEARQRDRTCPEHGKPGCQHCKAAAMWPDPCSAQHCCGGKCCRAQSVAAGKAGAPVPWRLPQYRSRAVNDCLERISYQRSSHHGCAHQPRFNLPPGNPQCNGCQHGRWHQTPCRAGHRDGVKKTVERMGHIVMQQPQNRGFKSPSVIRCQRGLSRLLRIFPSRVLIHVAALRPMGGLLRLICRLSVR